MVNCVGATVVDGFVEYGRGFADCPRLTKVNLGVGARTWNTHAWAGAIAASEAYVLAFPTLILAGWRIGDVEPDEIFRSVDLGQWRKRRRRTVGGWNNQEVPEVSQSDIEILDEKGP